MRVFRVSLKTIQTLFNNKPSEGNVREREAREQGTVLVENLKITFRRVTDGRGKRVSIKKERTGSTERPQCHVSTQMRVIVNLFYFNFPSDFQVGSRLSNE